MPLNPRFVEDALTNTLREALAEPEIGTAFWRMVAPKRMRSELPDQIKSCADELGPARLGGTNPDIIFYRRGKPVFYLEAKLGSGTEPLQLFRARSWMRAYGAQDDQVLLVSNMVDQLPSGVGWTGPTLPVHGITWHAIESELRRQSSAWHRRSRQKFESFSSFLKQRSSASRNKTKHGMLFPSGHRYGEVMRRFIAAKGYTKADLLYGARIDPRICIGRDDWQQALGTPDLERMELHYGPGRQGDGENYRAEFHLWHKTDLAHSRKFIEQCWPWWRQAIMEDRSIQFVFGGRGGGKRTRPTELPLACPNAWVAFICRPGSKIYERELRVLSMDKILRRISKIVDPLERVVDRVSSLLKGSS